jgi:hypothetical protein
MGDGDSGGRRNVEEEADIRGDSVQIAHKHYAKWSMLGQARISDLLRKFMAHEKTESASC